MSPPKMTPQPRVFDRLNKTPLPIELHLLQESRVAEERTSPPAPPPNQLRQEAADLSSRAMPIERRPLNQSPEIFPSSGFSSALRTFGLLRVFCLGEPFDFHSHFQGLGL